MPRNFRNRDAFGGRPGTQASRINAALLGGMRGTPSAIAARINEPAANVSAQLSWLHSRGLIARSRVTGREYTYWAIATQAPTPTGGTTRSVVAGYGIEIEFLVPAGTLSSGEMLSHVAAQLTAGGLPTVYAGYTHRTSSQWKIVIDSSVQGVGLQGMELVSPVLHGTQGEEQIRLACGILQRLGATVNVTSGFHVHHGVTISGSSEAALTRFHTQYARLESLFDALVPPSRRDGNMYCQSARNLNCFSTRYCKINTYHAWSRHHTIEFRQHSGTVEASKILPWIRLTRAFLNNPDVVAGSVEELCRNLNLSAADTTYFIGRERYFATRRQAAA